MEIDTKITLEDNKNYGILMKTRFTEKDYFLAVLLDDNDEETQTYAVLEEVTKDGESYVKKINDPFILNSILSDYREQYDEMLEDEEEGTAE